MKKITLFGHFCVTIFHRGVTSEIIVLSSQNNSYINEEICHVTDMSWVSICSSENSKDIGQLRSSQKWINFWAFLSNHLPGGLTSEVMGISLKNYKIMNEEVSCFMFMYEFVIWTSQNLGSYPRQKDKCKNVLIYMAFVVISFQGA